MKRQGDIKIVEDIEKLIIQTKNYRLIKDSSKGNKEVIGKGIPMAVYTRVYEIYNGEFVFTVQLEFDYRINRGRMAWQHKENTLIQAIPNLRPKLLALYPMSNGWRKEISYKGHMETIKSDIPWDIRRLSAIASNGDHFARELALESLANIRDHIQEIIENQGVKVG